MKRGGAWVLLGLIWACSTPPKADPDRAASSVGADSLVSTLEVKVLADTVRLVLHVTNPGRRAVRLDFGSAQRFDFVIESRGSEVWRWSADQMFAQVVGTETVAPGGSLKYDAVWRPGNRTGEFAAIGRLMSSGLSIERRTQFEIPGR